MSQSSHPSNPSEQAELSKRLERLARQEMRQLAEWSGGGQPPHTLAEMEQTVLGVLRRLGAQVLEELVDSEARKAPLSPPVRLRSADESPSASSQAGADADG